MSRRKRLILKAAFSVAFLFVLFLSVRESDFLAVLSDVKPVFFVLSFLLIPVMIPSSCLKWRVLLGRHGQKLRFGLLLRIYLVGYFFSNLLPSNVGGDVVRSFYVGRHIGSQSDAAVSTFIERFTGILLLLVLAIVAPLMKPGLYRHPHVFVPACGAAFLLLCVLWLWKVPSPLKLPDRLARAVLNGVARVGSGLGLSRPVGKLLQCYETMFGHLERFHTKLVRAVAYLGEQRRPFWSVVALTVFFYLMTWVNVYVSFRAFGVKPDFAAVAALVPAIMLVAMVPVTLLGNLGFTESVYVVFFSLIGVDGAASLSMGLLLRLKLLVVGVVGCLVYLAYRDRDPELRGLRESAPLGEDMEQVVE